MTEEEYVKILRKSSLGELYSAEVNIDKEKYPERYNILIEEIARKESDPSEIIHFESETEPIYKRKSAIGKLARRYYTINAFIVSALSVFALFNIASFHDSMIYFDFENILIGISGVMGTILYFSRFEVGHWIFILWWGSQSLQLTMNEMSIGLSAPLKVAIEVESFGYQIALNVLSIISLAFLVSCKHFYKHKISETNERIKSCL